MGKKRRDRGGKGKGGGNEPLQTVFTLPSRRRAAFIAGSAAFVVSQFLLMPLDVFLNNYIMFNVGLGDFAPVFLAVCAAAFAAIVLLFPLFLRGVALDVASLLLCGMSAGLYVQTLFFNSDMTQLTGDHVSYGALTLSRWINWAIFFVITVLPLYLWKVLSESEKYKKLKWENGIVYLTVVILGMQAVGIAAALPGYKPGKVDKLDYLSFSGALRLSARENIVFFIIDRFDVLFMDEVLDRHPELYEEFDGFTYYRNNVSIYSGTFPSMTHMLTGEFYNGTDTWPAYWEKAWARRNIIDILRENGYHTTMLPPKLALYGSTDQIRDRFDNLVKSDKGKLKINHGKMAERTIMISLARSVPYFFKDPLLKRVPAHFSNEFHEWMTDDVMPASIGSVVDMLFYKHLKQRGLYTQNRQKTFTYVHLYAAHGSHYRYNSENRTLEWHRGTDRDQLRGSFAILNEYFEQMKKLGIYDNSSIIVAGDHGRNISRRLKRGDVFTLDSVITTALMIKPRNSRGRLEKNSAAELSHINFGASILQLAGLPHGDFGPSYFDIIENGLPQTREYQLNLFRQTGRIVPATRYEIKGDANDFSNWKRVLD